jgi:SAM-dependent methyltransferase
MDEMEITFSFGENWKNFLDTVSEEQIKSAIGDITEWVEENKISGKKILDIGSGSGIHSYAFYILGAEKVDSFDHDPNSVEATRILWKKSGEPENWSVFQGSILDESFVEMLSKYDIVYSWGVLHHTGNMWNAIANATSLVNKTGYFWISIYTKGPNYQTQLKLKRTYNSASAVKKRFMEYKFILYLMMDRMRSLKNPIKWNERKTRGMDTYHDIVDWLGGLPYEVASVDEIVNFCGALGFHLERVKSAQEGDCSIYLFKRDN